MPSITELAATGEGAPPPSNLDTMAGNAPPLAPPPPGFGDPERDREVTEGLAGLKASEIAEKEKVENRMMAGIDKYTGITEAARRATSASMDAIPQPWNAQQMRDQFSTNPLAAFGSAASVFAILASSFTHAPMMNALNGSAAAMNAIRSRNDEDYQKAFDAWKANSDLAIKRTNMMRENFRDALELLKTQPEVARAQLAAIATKFGDRASLMYLENGMDDKLLDYHNKQAEAASRYVDAQKKLLDYNINWQVYNLDPRSKSGDPQQMKDAWQDAQGEKLTPMQDAYRQYIRQNPNSSAEQRAKFIQDYSVTGRGGIDQQRRQQVYESILQNIRDTQGREPTAAEKADANATAFGRGGGGTPDQRIRRDLYNDAVEEFRFTNGREPTAAEKKKLYDSVTGKPPSPGTPDQQRRQKIYEDLLNEIRTTENREPTAEEEAHANDVAFGRGAKAGSSQAAIAQGAAEIKKANPAMSDFQATLQAARDWKKANSANPPINAEIERRTEQYKTAGMNPNDAFTKASQEVRRAQVVPSGPRIMQAEDRVDAIGYSRMTADKAEKLINKHWGITGLGGTITRKMETTENILGMKGTDRAEFESYIRELQAWAPLVLLDRSARPLSAESGQMAAIIKGLRLGDTAANTKRAFDELRPLWDTIQKQTMSQIEGTWTPFSQPGQAPATTPGTPTRPQQTWDQIPLAR